VGEMGEEGLVFFDYGGDARKFWWDSRRVKKVM